jgi:hypothetical protein
MQISMVDVLRKFIKLGFLVIEAERDPSKALLIKEGEEISKIRFL